MTAVPAYTMQARRADLPLAERELDDQLARAVRRTSFMRQGFYVVVLLVAMAGQVSGAVEALHIPLAAAIPAVAALELGGIVVMANSDVRRRLGERAIASRILSALIAAWAVAFNWLAHSNRLLGGFFAGMSALGYLVWLMHTENQRRDRLRAKGDLPPTTPKYEVVAHWLRHPLLTQRAKSLAKANPELGLYDSLDAARDEVRRERQQRAISTVLRRKIRSAVDTTTADIAVAVYDLDEIATRLADTADYDGLTKFVAADLAPDRIAGDPTGDEAPPAIVWHQGPAVAAPTAERSAMEAAYEQIRVLPPAVRRDIEDWLHSRPAITEHGELVEETPAEPTEDSEAETVPIPAELVAELTEPAPEPATAPEPALEPAPEPALEPAPLATGSLRSRVHATLDANVRVGDERENAELVAFVADTLQLNDVERLTAASYVRTWRRDLNARHRAAPTRSLQAVDSRSSRRARSSRKLAG